MCIRDRLEDMDKATGNSSTSVAKMGAAFGAASKVVEAAMSHVKNCVGDAIKRFDTLKQFPKVMEQLGFDAEDASEATEKLSKGIQGPVSYTHLDVYKRQDDHRTGTGADRSAETVL